MRIEITETEARHLVRLIEKELKYYENERRHYKGKAFYHIQKD
jgi:hypothetical protein